MVLKDIVTISGKPGLYEIKAKSKGRGIVESLIDGKRFPISSAQTISSLGEIAVFTIDKELPLSIILKTIFNKEEGKPSISPKETTPVLMSYFKEIVPNFDEERVYCSNIKKILQWYNLLLTKEFDFSSIEEGEDEKKEVATKE